MQINARRLHRPFGRGVALALLAAGAMLSGCVAVPPDPGYLQPSAYPYQPGYRYTPYSPSADFSEKHGGASD
jgi:hypothetical protein